MHILILGGTTEASKLAEMLAGHPHIRATLSLAGRTKQPILPHIPSRIGGFGGVEGLVAWIHKQGVTALVDATHPFARIMPFHAAEAARLAQIPILSLLRPEWQPMAGDQWIMVQHHHEAINALGAKASRVFLTVGRLELPAYAAAPQHFYLVRSIDEVSPKPLPNALWINARPPFTLEGELALLREHHIEYIISKNSGGEATQAKLLAARMLGLPVIMLQRPDKPDVPRVRTASAAMEWIGERHHDACS